MTGASSAAFFVPGPFRMSHATILLSDGSLPSDFELFDLPSAQAFHLASEQSLATAAAAPLASRVPGALLFALHSRQPLWSLAGVTLPGEDEQGRALARAADHDLERREHTSVAWLGLCFASDAAAEATRRLTRGRARDAATEAPPWLWRLLLELGGGLAGSSSLVGTLFKDPISGLPDRNVFRIVLAEAVNSARARERPLSLLLVNPDNFGAVNAALGRERADEIVSELGVRLRAGLRGADFAARYGGVVFAVLLLDTTSTTAAKVASKLLAGLGDSPYGATGERLSISIGFATFDSATADLPSPFELTRRADRALLAAKDFGGGHVAAWDPDWEQDRDASFDRLATVFTGDLRRDYRNMALLWETTVALTGADRVEELVGTVLRHIVSAFGLSRICLFAAGEEAAPKLIFGVAARESEAKLVDLKPDDLEDDVVDLVRTAFAQNVPSLAASSTSAEQRFRWAFPLGLGRREEGGLYVATGHELDATDRALVESLGRQLMLAVERRRMEAEVLRREGQARRRLEEEVEQLRETLVESKLLYRSRSMDALMVRASRVAKTEATVLITGESGTGKELLARELHRLSPRSAGPFVVVDCGAIAANLIERELFGHERGAFTGAQSRGPGRLAEAAGGTVLLDEVTELPLESQVKLLRFVQEKQFTPVGSTRMRAVDVRILAATNRDPALEIAAGRFREDLFYRLNVIRLEIAPLRDRPQDILLLARRFLKNYGFVHRKRIDRFSRAAESELLVHDWPGNVRELQNRVQQAVILCQGERIEAADLGLGETAAARSAAEAGRAPARPPSRGAASAASVADSWSALENDVEAVFTAAAANGGDPVPLGRWLADDLLLAADRAAEGNASRGALLCGLPETTYRRRRDAVRSAAKSGLRVRPDYWAPAERTLAALLASPAGPPADLAARLRALILRAVGRIAAGDERAAARWAGVTAATWRRRVALDREE